MAITLAQLRARVQTLYDVEGSTVLTDPQWNTLVNDGIRALWADVTAINKDFRVTAGAPFTIASGQTNPLPADFREVRGVAINYGTSSVQWLTRSGLRSGAYGGERTYRVQGANLVIEPFARAPGTYTLLYVPAAPVLVNDGDVFDAELEQFQDYPVLHAVVEALGREESDITQFAAMLGAVKSRVTRWAADARSADPGEVEDVRGRTWFGWSLP